MPSFENSIQCGLGATLISEVTALVAVSMTETVPESWLGTYSLVPSGVTAAR